MAILGQTAHFDNKKIPSQFLTRGFELMAIQQLNLELSH